MRAGFSQTHCRVDVIFHFHCDRTLHRQATAYHLATGGMRSCKLVRSRTAGAARGGNGAAPYGGHVGASFMPMHHLAHHLSRFNTQQPTGAGVAMQHAATS